MTFADGWTCRACCKPNRPRDEVCYHCKTVRDADEAAVKAAVEAARAAKEARAQRQEAVPDIVVALPVVIFRAYSRVWLRGGMGVLGLLLVFALGGVTDIGWLALTGGMGAGLIIVGFLASEVSDAMREREVWAFVVGVGLSVVAVIGSVLAFEILAPGLANPNAIRWASVVVFGGAGAAAVAGLVLMFTRRDRTA